MEYSSGSVQDYYTLMKPRVMSLVIFTSLVGLILSPESMHPFLAIISISCIAIGAGASGVLNMWYDADIDSIMKRTIRRPIPSGSVTKSEALTYGLIMSFGSVFVMGVLINWISAIFLAFTIFFYAVVYTIWLKRRTTQNIVIGGAAGAFPPIIGWLSTSAPISIEPILLFFIIFFWTPPHFWALAILTSNEYEKASIPMMPNISGKKYTIRQIFLYSIIMSVSALIPFYLNMVSIIYILPVFFLNLLFIGISFQLFVTKDSTKMMIYAKRLFIYSILYLFLVFTFFLIDYLYIKYSWELLL